MSKPTIVVIGAGGHAKVVIDAIRRQDVYNIIGLTCPDAARKGEVFHGETIIGDDDVIPPGSNVALGIGNRASRTGPGLGVRRRVFEAMTSLEKWFPPIVHPRAIVSFHCNIGEGAQIMAGAIINPGARIGRNTIINTGAIVEHDCLVGAHCHIAPGAILCGGVKIGDETHVGAGAIILQGRTIGAGVVVAAGHVVRRGGVSEHLVAA